MPGTSRTRPAVCIGARTAAAQWTAARAPLSEPRRLVVERKSVQARDRPKPSPHHFRVVPRCLLSSVYLQSERWLSVSRPAVQAFLSNALAKETQGNTRRTTVSASAWVDLGQNLPGSAPPQCGP